MLFRRRKTSDDIRPLRGWAKFFHRLGRFILLPLRHPIITILLILVLFLAPTFNGVKPVNVPNWYATQISKAYNKVLIWWGIRQPEVSPGEFKFHPEEAAPAPVAPTEYKVQEPIDENAPNILDVLRGDQKTPAVQPEETDTSKPESTTEPVTEEKTAPASETQIDDKPFVESESADANIPSGKEIKLPKDNSLYAYPTDKKVYSLKYLEYPHEVEGKAKVLDCNEIEINGEVVMLYGIYVHPYTVQGTKATEYLSDLIDGKIVKCGIIAYTSQNIATGICYYGGSNLNRSMVTKGYTKNVAL